MRRSMARVLVVSTLAGAAAACGSSGTPLPATPATGFFIVISNMTFTPPSLRVPAGATVTVVNQDSTTHSVTSEATSGAYTRGSVGGVSFDTGPFTGVQSFAIPATAATGTVIPFFCTVHTTTMVPPNGSITIDPTAQPTNAPAGSPGMGGGGGGY